jgi:hypothetical protein
MTEEILPRKLCSFQFIRETRLIVQMSSLPSGWLYVTSEHGAIKFKIVLTNKTLLQEQNIQYYSSHSTWLVQNRVLREIHRGFHIILKLQDNLAQYRNDA